MVMNVKRWLFSLFTLLMVIGIISGCSSPSQNVNNQAHNTQSSNQMLEGNETTDDSGEQSSVVTPSAAPEATGPTSSGENQDVNKDKDKATQPPADNQATSSPKPKPTNIPKLDDPKSKPTVKPSKVEESVSPKPSTPVETPQPVQTVTISIVADEETGTVLAPTAVEIEKDDTVLEVLKKITRKNKIQMEYKGVKAGAYIEGIDNVYEFDFGAKSGWMYKVNGEFPNKGAGAYKLKEGDIIEWIYTIDLGEDIGAKFNE